MHKRINQRRSKKPALPKLSPVVQRRKVSRKGGGVVVVPAALAVVGLAGADRVLVNGGPAAEAEDSAAKDNAAANVDRAVNLAGGNSLKQQLRHRNLAKQKKSRQHCHRLSPTSLPGGRSVPRI